MSPRPPVTLVAPMPPAGAVSGLAALAFGSAASMLGGAGGKHLAFLPLESLELDLGDPEQRDFGDYELLEQLGQGGMGVVYRARQRSLDRDVALKLLAAGPWASPDFISRFTREAQSAARLQHPNIVPIYEIGTHAELNFFSMALVRGQSLAQRIDAGGALAPKDAAVLVRSVAEAVDYAHRLGILHLDLKPANVLLDERGEPQVADFGLARRLDETLSNDSEEVSGTPSYMAPEQAQVKSHRLSVATDVYGLGAILYELLTGRPPFLGASARETLQQVVTRDAVAPRTHNHAIPADLDAICTRCLARNPAQRYVTARGLAEDLGRFLEGRAVSVRPLNWMQRTQRWARREPRVALAVAAATAALLAGLAATSLQWRRAELQSQRAEQAAADARETLWQKRGDDAAALLRERKSLDTLPGLVQNLAEQDAAGATEQAERSRLRIGSVLADAPVLVDAIAVGDRITGALLDPAGQWVAVTTGGGTGVQGFDLATGTRRWSIEHGVFRSPLRLTLASDSHHLIAEALNIGVPIARGLGTHLIDLATGERREPPADRFPDRYAFHFSPDATHALVVTRAAGADGSPRGRLVRVADWQVLGVEHTLGGLVLLGPGGAWFAYYDGELADNDRTASGAVEIFDAQTMTPRWRYRPESGAALRAWRIAPQGRLLALGFADGEVGLFDPLDGTRHGLPSRVTAEVDDLYFSADGRWIAAAYREGSVQIWDVASATPVALPMHLSPDQANVLGEIALDPQGRRAYIAAGDSARLWHLPGPEHAPEAMFERPGYPRPILNLANAAAIGQGLYAAGAVDGELRVWRHRPPSPLPAKAPLQEMRDAQRRFDGRHAMHVDGARVQLRGLDAQGDGAVLEFPQAVGFARTLGDGGDLVVTAGREVHVRDGLDGTPRFPPLVLPATPSALLVGADGKRLVLAWNEYRDGVSRLALRSIDATNGTTRAETSLDHPAYVLQLSDDGASVLAWRYGPITLLDAATLQPRWVPRDFVVDSGFSPVRGARLGRDGRTLWVVSGVGSEDGYRLHALDAASGEEQETWALPGWAMALQPFDRGEAVAVLIPNAGELRLARRGGGMRTVKLAGLDPWGYFGLALSEDERRLAVGLKRGIQWLELPGGDWLGPMLQPPASGLEFAGVALDPSGSTAVLHDSDRHQWRYDLVREPRPVAELQALARMLMPAEEDIADVLAPPRDATLRAALRAADPGPPPAPIESGSPAQAPASTAALETRFVDLRPHCNFDLDRYPNDLHLSPRVDRMLAPGRQRLLGIEFELHCGIATTYAPQAAASVALGSRIEGIAVAQTDVVAIELLLLAPTMLKDSVREDYGVIELAYRDGSRARVALAYGRDLEAWFNPDYEGALAPLLVAHAALAAQYSLHGGNTPVPMLYAVRVANPYPERALASLALESTRHAWSAPLLLAATLEPPAPAADATPASGDPR